MFAAWSRILAQVPGSVLVMLKYPEESEPNVRYAARQVGLTGDALLMLPKAPIAEHLQRTSFCDLFVDNRESNAVIPAPPLLTTRTRRVLHPVLIGHAASFTPY